MKILTVSSKRQITLSKFDLDELKIQPGDKILMQKSERGLYLSPAPDSVVDEVAGSLKRFIARDKLSSTDEEIMSHTKKVVAKKIARK